MRHTTTGGRKIFSTSTNGIFDTDTYFTMGPSSICSTERKKWCEEVVLTCPAYQLTFSAIPPSKMSKLQSRQWSDPKLRSMDRTWQRNLEHPTRIGK